ncbi:hypothetical protein TUM20983_54670 [Mycobacterium antarcticum]|uniref:DUF998 domain-containing protein n=1 Tax=unclassified Mycolicibacterium TaxID=2636767 RepID=UPI00239C0B62|nr:MULTISPECIES: DUF998 domain-containing protein [unclassified Mycolicibacterium]GLP78357.1 hypothetical protein TUM20983_54670 [Mycolicibacterium sp. TUM20983]GLP81407.1 hypothetical protein TUM20984_28270 [Mycolicibacterium sp. TUM20984]
MGEERDAGAKRSAAAGLTVTMRPVGTSPGRVPRLVAVDDALWWLTVVGTLLGIGLYSNWLLEFAIDFTLPDPDAFISELAAADQPYGAWFRGLDLAAAGCLAAAAAAGIARSKCALVTFGWWMLAAFAAVTVLDSTIWSLRCAPHSDVLCAAHEAAGALPLGHHLHTLSSVAAIVVAFGSLIAFVLADVVGRTPRSVVRLGRIVLAALSAATVWTVIAVAIDDTGRDGDVGLAQRAQLLAVAGWLTYVALRSVSHRPQNDGNGS